MTFDLFDGHTDGHTDGRAVEQSIAPGALLLRGFASSAMLSVWRDVASVASEAPFRHLRTPGGRVMSVAMTNCGDCGWVSDAGGYRYEPTDPLSGAAWPSMPASLRDLARRAASRAGYAGFEPDACLINRYAPGARMSLHQDRDERDFSAPIVSVSFGLPAVFVFGGAQRSGPTQRVPLQHGDVVVWGGPTRLAFHGVLTLRDGEHPAVGRQRINLTFRKAR